MVSCVGLLIARKSNKMRLVSTFFRHWILEFFKYTDMIASFSVSIQSFIHVLGISLNNPWFRSMQLISDGPEIQKSAINFYKARFQTSYFHFYFFHFPTKCQAKAFFFNRIRFTWGRLSVFQNHELFLSNRNRNSDRRKMSKSPFSEDISRCSLFRHISLENYSCKIFRRILNHAVSFLYDCWTEKSRIVVLRLESW